MKSVYKPTQAWLNECDSSHQSCVSTSNVPLPTRVLFLSRNTNLLTIKLIESQGMTGSYCALSHCWDPPEKRPLHTTRGILPRHLVNIPFAELPLTFQEAAQLALGIGICYLWIDSLCIIQGDTNDWHSEAKAMRNIYRHGVWVDTVYTDLLWYPADLDPAGDLPDLHTWSWADTAGGKQWCLTFYEGEIRRLPTSIKIRSYGAICVVGHLTRSPLRFEPILSDIVDSGLVLWYSFDWRYVEAYSMENGLRRHYLSSVSSGDKADPLMGTAFFDSISPAPHLRCVLVASTERKVEEIFRVEM